MKIDLLTAVTARLRHSLSVGCDPQERQETRNWKIGQPRPILGSRIVVIPPYFDGHMGFGPSYIWEDQGTFHVINIYGTHEEFPKMLPAIKFMLEV